MAKECPDCVAWHKHYAELKDELDRCREAMKKLLMVTLPPHDVSGKRMYREAKHVLPHPPDGCEECAANDSTNY